MKSFTAMALAISLLGSGSGFAAASKLHVTKTAAIDASAASVWKVTKDFDGWKAWHPAVTKDEIVEGKNNGVGAVRVLTLPDGGTIKERLVAFDDKGRSFKYVIIESVLPVSAYSSTFVVKPLGKDKSTVLWTGTFKRKNTGDSPGEKENDKTAVDTISGVYQAGLDNLKKVVEAK